MLNFLPYRLVGLISISLLALNVIFWTSILFVLAFFKLVLPLPPLRRLFDRVLTWLAENWIACNGLWIKLTRRTAWDVEGLQDLHFRGWYLVISNHQSWVDIFVLQKILNRRIPLMKFFLKRELIWVPFMGLAWWALDFPFLRRYSAQYLKRNPTHRGKDFETTRKACAKFTHIPTSVMNFLEGTRFTEAKHIMQNRPYQYLLKPKAGGIGLALSVLGDKFQSLLNVTIVYPEGIPTFWGFLCGKVTRVSVRVTSQKIPQQFFNGDYENDGEFRTAFQQWVQGLWQDKDRQIAAVLEEAHAS